MKSADQKRYRQKLKAKRIQLNALMRVDGLHIERSADPADVAASSAEAETNRKLLNGNRFTLLRVTAALRRMEQGMYGICLSCDSEISKQRLNAVPEASLCVACQSKKERDLSLEVFSTIQPAYSKTRA